MEALGENTALPLLASGNCGHSLWLFPSDLCLFLHVAVSSVFHVFFYVCVSLFSVSFIRTLVIELKATQII